MDDFELIQILVNELNQATLCYDIGLPYMSDKEWDEKYFYLKELEQKTGIRLANSPTNSIPYEVVNQLNKVEHNHKMLSLDKTKDLNEVEEFIDNKEALAMAKLDGLTCSLTYENGKLVRAETRGNGLVGEDILHNIIHMPSVPKTLNGVSNRVVIDGEVICTLPNFHSYADEYKNSRNFAAGSIRLLDSEECKKRKLTFIAWEVIEGFEEYKKLSDKLNELKGFGFIVVPYTIVQNITQDVNSIREITNNILPIDGIVFKFNNIKYGKSLGETAHHFKNAIAYKFYDETYSTKMLDIEFTMGRTGVLTPVAIFEPVEIDGTTVERANLHNISVMRETLNGGSFVGQKIEVFKSNAIIPQIVSGSAEYVVPKGAKLIHIPKTCPICGDPVKIIENDNVEQLFCDNPSCQGKLINRLDHFCGKKGLDIKGLSKATLEKLISWNWVSNYLDIFELKKYRKDWIKKPGFGEKSVNNILEAIEKARDCNLEAFISSIGIPMIGVNTAKDLAKEFKTYENFKNHIEQGKDFLYLNGFGPELNKSLTNFDYSEADNLIINYLNLVEPKEEIATKTLENLIFVITGSLKNFKNRTELQKLIENAGGKVTSSVSKNTSYLINNDKESSSSKNLSAQKLGIEIISEKEFLEKFDFLKNI